MSVLTSVAVLVAIGLLFAIDPGGAIAASGFPDLREMDWKQLAVWGFRTIGVLAAQILIIALWFWPKHRPPEATDAWYFGSPRPGSMPAAAVSVFEGHMTSSSTTLASIIEMCQRETLRIEAFRTRSGFQYRLSRQGSTQFDWERTICENLPTRATTVDELRERIESHRDTIGDQIGAYLQQRGLFHENPVRVRTENSDDASEWGLLAGVLMGVGSGLWSALWLEQWWANSLIGAFAGLVYWLMAPTIRTGMVSPTQRGADEIGQWLGWKKTMGESVPPHARNQADLMLPYAVALNVAQPWLDDSASAPTWFGSGEASSLRGAGLDAAYRSFMHAPGWWLIGRSDGAAKAAPSYQPHRRGEAGEEKKGGGCLRGCFTRALGLAAIGVVVMLVLFSLDVVSPREKPCPLDSPPILTPAQIATAADLLRDECVRVRGTVVSQAAGELVFEMQRGEFVQRVHVRDPSEVIEAIPPDLIVTLAGRLRIEEDGTYTVHFIPDHGSDRAWRRNLLDNIQGLF